MKINLPKFGLSKFRFKYDRHIPVIIILAIILVGGYLVSSRKIINLTTTIQNLIEEKDKNLIELERIGKELEELKNQDQVKRNDELQAEIENIEKSYNKAVSVYEDIIELRYKSKDVKVIENQFAEILAKLAKKDYSGANDTLNQIAESIKQEEAKQAASFTIPTNISQSNTPPGSGYSRQSVNVEGSGTFLVSVIAADLAGTRVIIDTASETDCSNECPTLPLATYVSRSNAYAGIHGAYACPAEYPSCAGKTNSFDLLIMNKNKYYFNSANNVYSTNPAVIFGNGYVRFVAHASEWGRDTGVDGVISNFPLLVFGGNITYSEPGDNKMSIRSSRGFVANKGSTVYIGVVFNATVAESAKVMKALGFENAMNLDGGGSTALWHGGGYKAGPGRNLTNVILFLNK